jgi:hypothetical protein
VVTQVLFVQVEIVCAAVVVHSEAEQHAGAAMPMHVLPPGQVRWPVGHVPLQAAFCAMHVPLQFCGRVLGQAWTHAVPLQLTLPPTGVWQAVVHSVRPQVAVSLLLAHTPLQLW